MKNRVGLEPELEEIAGEWGPLYRLEMADKMERWIRQLRISARITLRDRFWRTPRPVLKRLPLRKARLN
jgi:hypothetical protein